MEWPLILETSATKSLENVVTVNSRKFPDTGHETQGKGSVSTLGTSFRKLLGSSILTSYPFLLGATVPQKEQGWKTNVTPVFAVRFLPN